MNLRQLGLGIALTALVAFDGWVIYQFGYIEIFRMAFANPVNLLMTIDGAIAIVIAVVLLGQDTAERRISIVPYALLTLGLESAGALLYLIRRAGFESRNHATPIGAVESARQRR